MQMYLDTTGDNWR